MRKKYTNFIIEKATGEFLAKLIRKNHDDYGADYILAGGSVPICVSRTDSAI